MLKFQKAIELHAQQSTSATIALLQRNHEDFDQPELLKQMFLKAAHEKALALRSSENAEFKAKQIHQVNGQLIRSGIFQKKAFTEAVPFTLKLNCSAIPQWSKTADSRPPSRTSNMKPLANLILASCLAVQTALAEDAPKPIQDLILDDHTMYSVPVSGARVTTVSFPSAISAIDGAFFTTNGKVPGLFQISHTEGTSYFSARALAKSAWTNLNIRWRGRTYVVELKESTEPWLS